MIRRNGLLLALCIALASVTSAHAEPSVQAATLDHVAIQVTDLDRSVAFYRTVFDLPETPAPFPGARWLVLGDGIMLHIVGNRTERSEHSRWDHIAITCGDMDAMIAKLDEQRIPWVNMDGAHTPQVRPDGVKQIFIQDPDGYWIEINDANKSPS